MVNLGYEPAIPIRRAYNLVVEGKIPVVRDGRSYLVEEAAIPAIAAALGMTPRPKIEA
jgi:hypothetical protein